MSEIKVPIARTSLTEEEMQSVLRPLEDGWIVQGPKVKEFEEKWSNFTGAGHSIAVTSCTSGLYLSLHALGIGPGDEVLVPAFTWVSTANVVEHLGAKPVFVDIDCTTFNVDPSLIEQRITQSTKAIMPVHLFGLAAPMGEVLALAQSNSLRVVEDAACGFGSTLQGIHVGNFGDAGVFSFHPRKAITTGEGGMITTDDDELATRLRRLRDHGAGVSDLQRHLGAKPYLLPEFPDAGFNLRMTDIQGALGSAQMNRADSIVLERQLLARNYDAPFKNLGWLRTPAQIPGAVHSFQSYACIFMADEMELAVKSGDLDDLARIGALRDSWMEYLLSRGISSRPATHSVPDLAYYSHKYSLLPRDNINAYAASVCSISLPLFHGMTEIEQGHVIETVLASRI